MPAGLRDVHAQWYENAVADTYWYKRRRSAPWVSHYATIAVGAFYPSYPKWTVIQTRLSNATAMPSLGALETLYKEAAAENWDGEGGRPMQASTYALSREFLQVMPRNVSAPELSVYPRGEVAFEWIVDPSHVLTVILTPDGVLHYAGLFGSSKVYGTEVFSHGVPEAIENSISRLLAAANGAST